VLIFLEEGWAKKKEGIFLRIGMKDQFLQRLGTNGEECAI
jgi:hypothetical protein